MSPARRPPKQRLDQLVLSLMGIADLKVAQGLIMAGKVVVDGSVLSKPGQLVSPLVHIHLRERPLRYASRGGYKLEQALRRFQVGVSKLVCLDAGASTGGFTDCLLQHGAERVYAVDVGYGQLRGKLATDLRVVNLERTNISDVIRNDLDPPIQFASADLSYLTLRKAVAIVAGLFTGPPHMVFLVKPLYEGLAQHQTTDRVALERVLRALFDELADQRYPATDACVSPVLGGRGAIEFLVRFGGPATTASVQEIATRALEDLDRHPPTEMPEVTGEDE
jgi:23S rRNA (cytidine1920-2'-O)/16S rRNA (cytidine1409-2'-O)-methyltransferase